jgi:hypothetical protein
MRGTGPGARKRLQREGNNRDEQYVKLYLTEEEARLIFEGLRQLPLDMGTRAGAVTMNILYRITEQVMTREELFDGPVVKKKKAARSVTLRARHS